MWSIGSKKGRNFEGTTVTNLDIVFLCPAIQRSFNLVSRSVHVGNKGEEFLLSLAVDTLKEGKLLNELLSSNILQKKLFQLQVTELQHSDRCRLPRRRLDAYEDVLQRALLRPKRRRRTSCLKDDCGGELEI